MGHLALLDWIIIIGYLMGMVAIGFWLSKRHSNFDDFFLAGRSLTTPLLVTTLISTYYGIDVLFGNSQLGFTDGVVAWFGYSRPTYIFFILAAFLLARKLKEEEFKSLPDILDRYYGKETRYVGALASFLYTVPALSLYGFGRLTEVVFGWEPIVGSFILGGVALLYTLSGGFWAVALTDAVQFLMMCLVVAIGIPFALDKVGGFDQLLLTLDPHFFYRMGNLSIWLIIIYASTGLTIMVDPTFYQRIFAAKSYKNVRNALLIGVFIWGAYDWCVTVLGMIAKTGALTGVISSTVAPDGSLMAIMVAALPAGLLGLFLAGTLAAAMSTLDSYCLVAGGNIAYDLYRPIFKPKISEIEMITKTRIGVVLAWSCGMVVAMMFNQMMGLWVFLASILISTVMVPILLGLFVPRWKRRLAGLLSAVSGLSATLILNAAVIFIGTYSLEEETYVLTFQLLGRSWTFLQEYIMFVTVPISLIAFFIGLIIDKEDKS